MVNSGPELNVSVAAAKRWRENEPTSAPMRMGHSRRVRYKDIDGGAAKEVATSSFTCDHAGSDSSGGAAPAHSCGRQQILDPT